MRKAPAAAFGGCVYEGVKVLRHFGEPSPPVEARPPSRRDDPAVLPVKFDDTNLDHLPEDCAYLDARIVGLRRIAECVRKKVRRS